MTEESVEPVEHDARVTISSMGNERRIVKLDGLNDDALQKLIQTINNAFGTVRASRALLLVGSDGVTTFANLDNVAFIEVQISS